MIPDIAQVLEHQTHEGTIGFTVEEAGSANKLVVVANAIRHRFKHAPEVSKRISGITGVGGSDVKTLAPFEIAPVRNCA
jgi:hypothetical protein